MKVLLAVQYYEPAWAYGGPPRLAFDVAEQPADGRPQDVQDLEGAIHPWHESENQRSAMCTVSPGRTG